MTNRDQISDAEPYFVKKVVLITGASSGVGRSLAYWYLNQGANVTLVARDIEELSIIAEQFPGQALAAQVDLTSDVNLADLKDAVIEKYGGIDILINCAGSIFSGDLSTTHPQDYDHLLDINMRAPFILFKVFRDYLIASKGCIINVTSDKGSRPEAGQLAYCMAKAGLEMMTKALAAEAKFYGIRVNSVAPSAIDSNFYRYTGLSDHECAALNKRIQKNIPMGRIADCTEVAKSVIFLTGHESKNITGQIIKSDGGKSLTSMG